MPNTGQFAKWRQDPSSKSSTFENVRLEQTSRHRHHVPGNTQNVQPVTNGTSLPKRLPDHPLSGRGNEEWSPTPLRINPLLLGSRLEAPGQVAKGALAHEAVMEAKKIEIF